MGERPVFGVSWVGCILAWGILGWVCFGMGVWSGMGKCPRLGVISYGFFLGWVGLGMGVFRNECPGMGV